PGEGVVIGLLDTGIDDANVDLASQIPYRKDGRCLPNDPQDGDGHGTEVASIIAAARNGTGVVGGAYGARLASIKIGSRKDAVWLFDIICALRMASNNPDISIINLSYGVFLSDLLKKCGDMPWLCEFEVELAQRYFE